MINRLERGHMLLSLLIVFLFVLITLFSIQDVIRHYLFQERSLSRALFADQYRTEEVVRMRSLLLESNDVDIQWLDRGVDQMCRVFTDKYDDSRLSDGWYGVRLSQECSLGVGYEEFGIYYVGDEMVEDYVSFSYLRREIEDEYPNYIDSWQQSFDGKQLVLTIVEGDLIYRYRMPERFDEAVIRVLKSTTDDAFYLLYLRELWLLPKGSESPYKLVSDIHQGGVLVADYIEKKGIYLLFFQDACKAGDGCFYIVFYPNSPQKVDESVDVLLQRSLSWRAYRVLLVDRFKVFIEVEAEDTHQLLTVMWDGRTVWGETYLWESQRSIVCPLQSQIFEPIKGWVIGCQRRL